ncbi:MAG TPA: neutral zinc metallopeptidase [Dermatophilaceae bacterium]|nr:neutral zinc metallopeptidase [Dermatophilaceae bacterium]
MSFNESADLDTSQVSGGGGGMRGGGLAVGGGAGGILLLVLTLIFGPGVLDGSGGNVADPGQVSGGGQTTDNQFERCKTGADANRDAQCRVIGTVNSVQQFWTDELPKHGQMWRPTKTVLYSGAARSACGTASNQVGPFYCPTDKQVYIDASFFNELTDRFGADDGALAQEYVVAHEYGHALQDQLNILGRAQQGSGAEGGSVRVELMADCLAGVWAKGATSTLDKDGDPYLKPLTQTDIASALSAASAVGDDRIQQSVQGRVDPESWTHGSSEQRQKWFTTGYRTGDLNQCDTFSSDLG